MPFIGFPNRSYEIRFCLTSFAGLGVLCILSGGVLWMLQCVFLTQQKSSAISKYKRILTAVVKLHHMYPTAGARKIFKILPGTIISSLPSLFSYPNVLSILFNSPRLLLSPKIYCLSPGPQSPLQAYCLLSRPTAYSPSLLHTLQAYCLLSKPTAYSPSLLHTLPTAYSRVLTS